MWTVVQEPHLSERISNATAHTNTTTSTNTATAELRTLPYTPDPLFEALLSRAVSQNKAITHAVNREHHSR